MNTWIWTFGAVLTVSLVSLIGIVTLSFKRKKLTNILLVLVAGHAFSRACAVSLLFASNYVGSSELSRARPVAQSMSAGEFLVAAVIGVIPLYWCGMHAVAGGLCALLTLFVLAHWFIRRLGGFTGDTLGAAQQLTEIAFYLGVLASWNSI